MLDHREMPPADAKFAAFVDAHLRTRVERAVFVALSSSTEERWTIAALAKWTACDEYDLDVTLREFVAAGIAECDTDALNGRRYRWGNDMNYLSATPRPQPTFVDPVCGMPVDLYADYIEESPTGAERFCSLRCQLAWQAPHRVRSRP